MSEVGEKYLAFCRELGPQITIVGVAKGQPVAKIEEAIASGLQVVANNYVQEGQDLIQAISALEGNSVSAAMLNAERNPSDRFLSFDRRVAWHFIGHIQSRKAKALLPYDCVQSLDRLSVATTLSRELESKKASLEVLVQVNIGQEPQKSGVLPQDLPTFLEALSAFPQLKLKGLMAIPPLTSQPEGRRPYFKMMRRLFEQHQKTYFLSVLSMGMSDDYRIAAEEGSTMVRLGTLLFGSRT